MERIQKALLMHFRAYPDLKIRDIFKYIFQSSFGCEHLVSSQSAVLDYIRKEYADAEICSNCIDALDGSYSRVHLGWLDNGLCAETFARLFLLSAKSEPNGRENLVQKLSVAKSLVKDGLLPFPYEEFEAEADKWEQDGFPAVHHSDEFRKLYKPAYRVISNRFVPYLPLFTEIDKRMEKGRVILAIEGGSASGKSTLGEILKEVYGCTLFHTDDFFLQPHQRTEERLSEIGGNLDRERFEKEVLMPLAKGDAVDYRRFDCGKMEIIPAEKIEPGRLTVVEGAYSMHPDLRGYYNFSVFLDVPEKVRKERILVRNSPYLVERFFNEWIPMENRYFSEMKIKELCDICIGGDIYDNKN